MVPSERCLIDLGEREAAALIGILNVKKVIMVVMVSVIPARSLLNARYWYCSVCHNF